MRPTALALLSAFAVACGPRPAERTASLCDLARDWPAHQNERVAVRGIFHDGLRLSCPQRCSIGPWPSYALVTTTEDSVWKPLGDVALRIAAQETPTRHFELWVTVHGTVHPFAKPSPLGPCDPIANRTFQRNTVPAGIEAAAFTDIAIVENPQSPLRYKPEPAGLL